MSQLSLDLRRRPRVLSYGGGLDSFAMLVRAVLTGELPDQVVFCDVGDPEGLDPAEWPGTYKHIREVVIPLCTRHGIPFVWLDTNRFPVRDARSLFAWLEARGQIPVAGPNRICTRIAKVERFERWLDQAYPGQLVEVWIGFEAGEEARAAKDPNAGRPRKAAPGRAVRINRFPLIEAGACRCRCQQLVRDAGFPVPPGSACTFCLAGETEVVTREGIRPISELAGRRHKLLVPQFREGGYRHSRGRFQEVEVRSFGVQPLYEVVLRREKSQKVVRATAEHRWIRLAPGREATTATLQQGDKLSILRATTPTKERLMSVAVAQGFVFGDGSRIAAPDERPASLTIYNLGKDSAMLPFFAGCEIRKCKGNGKPALLIYGLPRFWKDLPPLGESRAFLLSWLAGYFAADGSVSKQGQAVLESANRGHLQFARSVAAVCGVGYSKLQVRKRKGFLDAPGDLFRFSLRLADLPPWFFLIKKHRERVAEVERSGRDQPWVVQSVRPLGVEEEVYCATVPGSGAFGLAEDLMTGNCPYASKGSWQRFAAELPAWFDRTVQLEANKPPTSKGNKLSIMGYRTLKDAAGQVIGVRAPPLPEWIKGKYRPLAKPCTVCGAKVRAAKTFDCGYDLAVAA